MPGSSESEEAIQSAIQVLLAWGEAVEVLKRFTVHEANAILSSVTVHANKSNTRLLIERKLPVNLKDVILLVAYKHHGMPDYLPRIMHMVVTDRNGAKSPTVSIQVTFVGTNSHAPTLKVSQQLAHFTENSAEAVNITNGFLSLTDPDHVFYPIQWARIILSCLQCGEERLFIKKSYDGINVSYFNFNGTYFLKGNASTEVYRDLLNNVSYLNWAKEPRRPLNRSVTFVVSDGVHTSTALAKIVITNVNDNPFILINGGEKAGKVSFEEGQDFVSLTNQVQIFDEDEGDFITKATVALDSKDLDSFLWYNATIFPSGLTAKYNGSRRTLTIEGKNTRNVYSRALVSVQFYNQLSSPALVPSHKRLVAMAVEDQEAVSDIVIIEVSPLFKVQQLVAHYYFNN
ncbi:uncharacterized protein [Oscarella lobularis]|uniref:uncharacterized protein n=1 Tax=Oscarella lobularis TaxID=121494 RepID=UPI003313CA7F